MFSKVETLAKLADTKITTDKLVIYSFSCNLDLPSPSLFLLACKIRQTESKMCPISLHVERLYIKAYKVPCFRKLVWELSSSDWYCKDQSVFTKRLKLNLVNMSHYFMDRKKKKKRCLWFTEGIKSFFQVSVILALKSMKLRWVLTTVGIPA